jgi:RNA polymerase sigma factor (sigma-70 family)
LQNKDNYTEIELVWSLKNKDENALSYLYDNYAGALNAVIFNIVKDATLTEDILQESFLKIWNNIGQYDESKGRLFTWMRTLVHNLSLDKLKSKEFKKQTKIVADEAMVTNVADTQWGTNWHMKNYELKEKINNLEEKFRLLIDLSYFQGYTQEQIATSLNIPLGTVKTRIRSAILELRKIFNN